ncbi:MAG: U32 family peptidase [Hyphomicrobiales bacterium]|nr:MAG: U32 family peptidase [Hyphomicrobiales bacterium]
MTKAKLTLGPLLFNWPADTYRDFYARIADEAPVDRVFLGEVVCSKREPFHEDVLIEAMERLEAAGKTVVLSTLALVTLKRERAQVQTTAKDAPGLVEANDVSAVGALAGKPHVIGPLINTYSEGTLRFFAGNGAETVCLPPELPLASVRVLAETGRESGCDIEVFAFGRVPLAVSARCYHARVEGLAKDSCQFVCELDPDGRDVDTLDDQKFLAINGIQTMSQSWANLAADIPVLLEAGVTSFRLSPHSCDMVAVSRCFRDVLDGALAPDEAMRQLAALAPDVSFSNGFLHDTAGAAYVAAE